MGVLCTFKIKIESQNLDHGSIKVPEPYPNNDQNWNPSKNLKYPPNPKSGLKNMDALCTFKFNSECQNLDQRFIRVNNNVQIIMKTLNPNMLRITDNNSNQIYDIILQLYEFAYNTHFFFIRLAVENPSCWGCSSTLWGTWRWPLETNWTNPESWWWRQQPTLQA